MIIVYGASTSAYNIFYLLRSFDITPFCFVVAKKDEGGQHEIEGIPIYQADQCLPKYPNALILMAVLRQNYQEVETYVKSLGIKKCLPAGLDSDVDMQLRKAYFRKNNRENFMELDKWKSDSFVHNKDKTLKIFMVKNHKDKKLISVREEREEWLIPIQAGASNTELSLAQIKDNKGYDNISSRNNNYCELSAAYWIWKNVTTDYIGICHYRRKFVLSDVMIDAFIENDYDVIVPYPGFYAPDTKTAYLKVKPENLFFLSDWEYMMDAIAVLYPEYRNIARQFEKGYFFIHYNMLIAKKEIYYAWCEFWFSILEYVEELYNQKGEKRDDRYLGFLGEALTSLFIFYHQEYKIAYADISFIE